jgi:hypothetical protein
VPRQVGGVDQEVELCAVGRPRGLGHGGDVRPRRGVGRSGER